MFRRLREREGYGKLKSARVSRLLAQHERRTEIDAWRAGLTEKQRDDWASPEAIFSALPAFREVEGGHRQDGRVGGAPAEPSVELTNLRAENKKLKAENAERRASPMCLKCPVRRRRFDSPRARTFGRGNFRWLHRVKAFGFPLVRATLAALNRVPDLAVILSSSDRSGGGSGSARIKCGAADCHPEKT